jgi:hypothetical protein
LHWNLGAKSLNTVGRYLTNPDDTHIPALIPVSNFLAYIGTAPDATPLSWAFYDTIKDAPGLAWLLDYTGLPQSLQTLSIEIRNKAAHAADVHIQDYLWCEELVLGHYGILRLLATARPWT